jgi:hypothetical protein
MTAPLHWHDFNLTFDDSTYCERQKSAFKKIEAAPFGQVKYYG